MKRGASATAAIVGALLTLLLTQHSAMADTTSERDLGWLSLELDPMTTPLGARNLLLYVEPPSLPHWSAALIAFSAKFPQWMDQIMSYRNRGEDFEHEIRPSAGATVERFFAKQRSGYHLGLLTFLWRHRVQRGGDEANYMSHVILPRVGYRWFPFRELDIYLDPFAGLMFEYKVSGHNEVDGARHRSTPIIPFASVHLGYHF